jgi:hypothetical protein
MVTGDGHAGGQAAGEAVGLDPELRAALARLDRGQVMALLAAMTAAEAAGHQRLVGVIAAALAVTTGSGGPSRAGMAWAISTLRKLAQRAPLPAGVPLVMRPHDWTGRTEGGVQAPRRPPQPPTPREAGVAGEEPGGKVEGREEARWLPQRRALGLALPPGRPKLGSGAGTARARARGCVQRPPGARPAPRETAHSPRPPAG